MSILPIREYGDPVLNTPTTLVDEIDGKIAALAESMIETMYEAPGVGLAANQIGVQKRMFVYDQGEGPFVVINPVIVETSGEWTYLEGCLSVPDLAWEITRANEVHLTGFDLDGNELDIQTQEYQGANFSTRSRPSRWRAFGRTTHRRTAQRSETDITRASTEFCQRRPRRTSSTSW